MHRVVPDEWAVLRDVRLRALPDAPYAFASTHAREVAFDETDWRRRIDGGPWWLARAAGEPVGLVAGYATEDDGDVRHLVAMWVDPAHRGSPAATTGRAGSTSGSASPAPESASRCRAIRRPARSAWSCGSPHTPD